jgi:outer membrane protein insertion porin family
VPFTVGWSRDSRDSALAPTSGDTSASTQSGRLRGCALPAHHLPVPAVPAVEQAVHWRFQWRDRLGQVWWTFFPGVQELFGGGLGSVRGFEQGSLGPRDVSGSAVGGSRKFNLNAEVLTPFPGAGNDRSLRMYGFFDMGMVGTTTDCRSTSRCRQGASLRGRGHQLDFSGGPAASGVCQTSSQVRQR